MAVADLSAAGGDLLACNADLGSNHSACGHPCDVGNSLGVGKFCNVIADCAGNGMATICSSVLNNGDPLDTYFCTIPVQCDNTTNCGAGASCQTVPGKGSGCTPNRCATGLDP